MPRPKLATIDVPFAADFASSRWLRSAGSLAGAGAKRIIDEKITSLASWAMDGALDLETAEELLLEVIRWMYLSPLDDTDAFTVPISLPDGLDEKAMTDARGHLAVLLLAARGRVRLARLDVITVPELAALSDYGVDAIGRAATAGAIPMGARPSSESFPGGTSGVRLVRAGESKGKRYPAPITGESARELLVMVGTPGFSVAKRRAR